MSNIPFLNPLQQQILDMQALQNRVQALENGIAGQIPVYNTDPPASSGINIWALTDGRIHIRSAYNGTIFEVTTTTSSNSNSTHMVTPAVPSQTFVQSWYPVWTQSYYKNGTLQRSGTNLYFGYSDGYYESQMSIMTFPTGMTSALSGTTINYAHLWMDAISAQSKVGGTVHVGGGSYGSSAPSSYTSSFENYTSAGFPATGTFKVVLGSNFYADLVSGSLNGLTLNAPNTLSNNYGEVQGGGGYTGGVRLEISYTN